MRILHSQLNILHTHSAIRRVDGDKKNRDNSKDNSNNNNLIDNISNSELIFAKIINYEEKKIEINSLNIHEYIKGLLNNNYFYTILTPINTISNIKNTIKNNNNININNYIFNLEQCVEFILEYYND